MPPEPLPWDRRDLIFREKKHDRGAPFADALGSGGNSSTSRLRDPFHTARDFPGPSPRRPQTGYPRHHGSGSGYHDLSGEDPCTRSEENGLRDYQSGKSGGGGHRSNNNRDIGECVRRSSWDSSDLSRQNHEFVASQGSAADLSSHCLPLDDKQDAAGGVADHGTRAGLRQERDLDHSLGSLSWKPLKWNRSGSFSSSSKVPRSESDERKLEVLLPPGKEQPVESPVSSPLSPDEGFSQKKRRLGWGQGLAKYERAKTEASDDVCVRNPSQSGAASPRVMALPGSTSPATPASLTCSSSHGGDDKAFSEGANSDAATSLIHFSADDFRHLLEELSIDTEYLDLNSPVGSTPLSACLSLADDASPGDSSCMRQAAMGKLLLVKDKVLKQLEKTEADIDSFENELKKLKSGCHTSSKLDSVPEKNDAESPAAPPHSVGEPTGTSAMVPTAGNGDDDVLDGVANRCATPDADAKDCSLAGREEDAAECGAVVPDFSEDFQSITASIIASNQEYAKEASRVLDAGDSSVSRPSVSQDISSDREKDGLIRKMIGVGKRSLKFKEKALALKYRALMQLWKDDLQSFRVKKQRPKSHRKMELSRSSLAVVQKSRSQLRSRFPIPGGSTLTPTAQALEFTGRLLSDSHARVYRSTLRMPALVLDEKEKTLSRFVSGNGLVEEPCSLEEERSLVNPWTPEERRVFIEMLAAHGKDFSKIASFLDHKTTADCVEFYYKNHKSGDFDKVKKTLGLRKTSEAEAASSYLGAASSNKKWKRQVNAVSLDVLRAASSAMAAQGQGAPRQPYSSCEGERETSAADVLVGIMAAERRLPSQASGSSSEDGSEGFSAGDWTDVEKSAFISALASHGRDFARISRCVGSRSVEQCKIFFGKARKCLALDDILSRATGLDDVDSATGAIPSGSNPRQELEAGSPPTVSKKEYVKVADCQVNGSAQEQREGGGARGPSPGERAGTCSGSSAGSQQQQQQQQQPVDHVQKRPHPHVSREERAGDRDAKRRKSSAGEPSSADPAPALRRDWPELFLLNNSGGGGGGGKEAEHTVRACDVKIFGKILSHPPHPPRPSSPEKPAAAFLGPPSCGFAVPAFALDGGGRCDAAVAADAPKHQGRVGLGRVPGGGGAILVGGKGCNGGISDPVAAIKLHYAARAGVLSREEESWRADVGR